jgi:CubicO group peptidase (beta-lactamase class C family)
LQQRRSATPQFSQDIVERLDSAIASEVKYNDVPGVMGMWVPGEGQYMVARGKANLETGERRDLEDPFRIGSITKTFTATAVLQLVEQGSSPNPTRGPVCNPRPEDRLHDRQLRHPRRDRREGKR